ncbi:MAG: glycosyl transferase [Patescibacteria group bacterium]|nr:glycosyl transferase [Patescibacteria group bacterium]
MKKFPKKILLLSPVPPCSNYSGGLVLEHLARFLPKGSLVCFAVMNNLLKPDIPDTLKWIPVEYYNKPNEGWPAFGFRIGTTISLLGETYTRTIVLPKIIKKITTFAKKHQVDYLWSILDGQTTINLAVPVAKKLNVPMITEIWDPPEWYLKINNLDGISRSIVMRNFATALRLSQKLGAASRPMAKKYHEDYGVEAISFLPSLQKYLGFKPTKKPHPGKELIIAVAGQLYSQDEWNGLLGALHFLGWKIAGRKVKIRVLGNWFGIYQVYKDVNIEYLGWRSQEETVKIMNDSDILYCPYIFDRNYKKISELSFPSKLATYLAAGRPVFFHGPEYASPAHFLKEYQAGMLCHSLDKKKIGQMLTELAKNQKLYATFSANGHEAFRKYLTMDILHQKFAEFLAIEEKELLPVK